MCFVEAFDELAFDAGRLLHDVAVVCPHLLDHCAFSVRCCGVLLAEAFAGVFECTACLVLVRRSGVGQLGGDGFDERAGVFCRRGLEDAFRFLQLEECGVVLIPRLLVLRDFRCGLFGQLSPVGGALVASARMGLPTSMIIRCSLRGWCGR